MDQIYCCDKKFSYIEKLLQLTAVIGIMKYERFSKYLFFSLGLKLLFFNLRSQMQKFFYFVFALDFIFFIYLSLL